MRQGNGAELLGSNHPRSATIGIIEVSPTDEREHVLSAILSQEKIGRNQIAIILPRENIAFQKLADFDFLKNMQRKLQANLVIIAPSGPGPAEFARQRRFTYYTSPDSYTRSLLMDEQQPTSERKRWSMWPKASTPLPSATPTPPQNIVPMPQPQAMVPPPQPVRPTQFNLANNDFSEPDEVQQLDENTFPADDDTLNMGEIDFTPRSRNSAPALPAQTDDTLPAGESDEDTWYAAQEAEPEPSPADDDQMPALNVPDEQEDDTLDPPAPLPLPLPLPGEDSEPLPAGVQKIPVEQQDTQDLPADAEGWAIPAATPTPQPTHPSINIARDNTPPPPPLVVVPPGPPPAAPIRYPVPAPRRKRRSAILAALLILLLCVLLLCGGIALAAPSTFSTISNTFAQLLPGAPPSAAISLTAASQTLKDTYVIAGVTGAPNSALRQVQARQLTYTTPSQSKTNTATGVKIIPATQATGTLTFYNGAGIAQTVSASTTFTVGGETIQLTSSVTVPVGPPGQFGSASVSATAVPPGHFGNIAAFAIDEHCCSQDGSISVRNLSAFTGGVDQQQYTVVQQSDIDSAASPLKTQLMQSALTSITAQKHSNEQFVSSPQCKPNATSDHNVGDQASSVTVTVTATCAAEVYDRQGAQVLAASLLQAKAASTLDPHFVQNSSITTILAQPTITDPTKGTVSIIVHTQGLWVYQFTATDKANLARLIKGQTQQAAMNILQQQPGVANVGKISISNGKTLPTNSTQITFNVLNAPSFQGTGSPGVSGSPTTPHSTPSSSSQPGNG